MSYVASCRLSVSQSWRWPRARSTHPGTKWTFIIDRIECWCVWKYWSIVLYILDTEPPNKTSKLAEAYIYIMIINIYLDIYLYIYIYWHMVKKHTLVVILLPWNKKAEVQSASLGNQTWQLSYLNAQWRISHCLAKTQNNVQASKHEDLYVCS